MSSTPPHATVAGLVGRAPYDAACRNTTRRGGKYIQLAGTPDTRDRIPTNRVLCKHRAIRPAIGRTFRETQLTTSDTRLAESRASQPHGVDDVPIEITVSAPPQWCDPHMRCSPITDHTRAAHLATLPTLRIETAHDDPAPCGPRGQPGLRPQVHWQGPWCQHVVLCMVPRIRRGLSRTWLFPKLRC